MYLVSITSLFLTIMTKPLIIDSIIYAVDLSKMELREQTITGSIIDYSLDDHLYILTSRYLYKIDPDYLSIKDRIPLPQRFNYITANSEYIILVANGEIILLDKKNLAFKTGIGIEYGDYRPMTTVNHIISGGNNMLHLTAKSEGKSVMKIFDLVTGRLIKKKTINEVRAYEYSPNENLIIILDAKNKIVSYDLKLNEKNKLNLDIDGDTFISYESGFLIYNTEGIFFIAKAGNIIDFQPLPLTKQEIVEKFLFVTDHGIVYLDSLTLRPKKIFKGKSDFLKLFRVQSERSDYSLALDQNDDFHLLDLSLMTSISLTESEDKMTEKITELKPVSTDSIWYFQVGAFSNYHNAQQMITELRQRNIPVFIDSTGLYRVKFGGFYDKSKAIELIEQINLDGWFVFQNKIEQMDDVEFSIGIEKYMLKNGVIIRSN
ncbi:MAG: SPOR domain-containing protein [bacterium]